MIDIHSHILPGVDDGARNLDESLEMARLAVKEGIHTIIATPHHANGVFDNEAKDVIAAVSRLNSEFQSRKIPLQVLAGQEIRVNNQLIDDMDKSHLLTLNGSTYMLIEFPSARIPEQIQDLLHELRVLHVTPVIAHPERNSEIADSPDKLYSLVEAGALCQLTAHSLNGLFGKKIQTVSLELCKRNLVHFLASDAHNLSTRSFGLEKAYDFLHKSVGADYYEYCSNNARLLVEGSQIIPMKPLKENKKWYHIW